MKFSLPAAVILSAATEWGPTRIKPLLAHRVGDARLLALLASLIDHGAETPGTGMPIGNLTIARAGHRAMSGLLRSRKALG